MSLKTRWKQIRLNFKERFGSFNWSTLRSWIIILAVLIGVWLVYPFIDTEKLPEVKKIEKPKISAEQQKIESLQKALAEEKEKSAALYKEKQANKRALDSLRTAAVTPVIAPQASEVIKKKVPSRKVVRRSVPRQSCSCPSPSLAYWDRYWTAR